jgi:hypothetical protein
MTSAAKITLAELKDALSRYPDVIKKISDDGKLNYIHITNTFKALLLTAG